MKVFNTEFEVSMRLLILLNYLAYPVDEQKISYIDFITVNAKNYKLDDDNLNGDGLFMLNELTTQHQLIKESLKSLVLQGLINVNATKQGFLYSISESGNDLCGEMSSDYSFRYKSTASIVCNKLGNWTIEEIKKFAKEMEDIR